MQNHTVPDEITAWGLMQKRTYYLKRQPARGTLVRYDDRVAEVLGGAKGNRVMIRSVHGDGTTRITAVKWRNLAALGASLFEGPGIDALFPQVRKGSFIMGKVQSEASIRGVMSEHTSMLAK